MRALIIALCLGFLGCFLGCGYKSIDSIDIPSYPNFGELYENQYEKLSGRSLEKEIWLSGKKEKQILKFDSIGWKKQVSFLDDINPYQPKYIGVFEKEEHDSHLLLKLKKGENSTLKKLQIKYNGSNYAHIKASLVEDKDVFISGKEIEVYFEEGIISSWEIKGYQKMILGDSVAFRIKAKMI